jgi:methylmalonyl-CoA mutase C-terminal domain/subunit
MNAQRPLKVLVSKPGLDGHDKGAKVVAHALRNAGCEVLYTGLHKTVDQIVEAALQEDVDVIGLSILSGAHIPITEKLIERLKQEEMADIHVLVGGNIPYQDREKLIEMGVRAVFPTSSRLEDIVAFVQETKPRK